MWCTIRLDTNENFSRSMHNRRSLCNKFVFVDGSVWMITKCIIFILELTFKLLSNEILIFLLFLMNFNWFFWSLEATFVVRGFQPPRIPNTDRELRALVGAAPREVSGHKNPRPGLASLGYVTPAPKLALSIPNSPRNLLALVGKTPRELSAQGNSRLGFPSLG